MLCEADFQWGEWLIQIKTQDHPGSKVTQQKSQCTGRPAATYLGPQNLCCKAGSQEAIRIKPAKYIRLKQTKTWSCGGWALHRNGGAVGRDSGNQPLL